MVNKPHIAKMLILGEVAVNTWGLSILRLTILYVKKIQSYPTPSLLGGIIHIFMLFLQSGISHILQEKM